MIVFLVMFASLVFARVQFTFVSKVADSVDKERVDPDDTIAFFDGNVLVRGNESVYGSTDGGKTWKHQWSGKLYTNIRLNSTAYRSMTLGAPEFFTYPITSITSNETEVWTLNSEDSSFGVKSIPQTSTFSGFPSSLELSIESGGRAYLSSGEMLATGVIWGSPGPGTYPTPPGPCCNGTVVLFSSVDDGQHWEYKSTILSKSTLPTSQEGANENAISLAADGKTLVAIIRVDGGDGVPDHRHVPYVRVTSTDNGSTWSKPTSLPSNVLSCKPKLALHKPSSTLLLSGGRPGVRLWQDLSGQGEGAYLEYDIPTQHNALLPPTSPDRFCPEFLNATTALGWAQSSGYTSLSILNETHGLVCYNRQGFPSGGYSKPIPKDCAIPYSTIYCMGFEIQ